MSAETAAAGQLRSFVERIERVDDRISYVAARLPGCLGLDERTTARAHSIACRLLGMRYEAGRLALCALLLGDRSLVEKFVGAPDWSLVGFVYRCEPVGRADMFKVGFSQAPEFRVRALSVKLGMPLRLCGYETGTMLDEHVQHCRLRPQRLFGEWFAREADEIRQSGGSGAETSVACDAGPGTAEALGKSGPVEVSRESASEPSPGPAAAGQMDAEVIPQATDPAHGSATPALGSVGSSVRGGTLTSEPVRKSGVTAGERPGTLSPEREAAIAERLRRQRETAAPLDPTDPLFAIRFKARHLRDPVGEEWATGAPTLAMEGA